MTQWNDWSLDDGRVIRLLTPEELKALPVGTTLFDIFGEEVVTGSDYIDDDTRAGYTAYGTLVSD